MMAKEREAVRFEVDINGANRVIAGVPHGLVSAIITWVARDAAEWDGDRTLEEWVAGNAWLSVGGIDGRTDEFIDWIKEQTLAEGDEITITVLGPGDCDEPIRRHSWTDQSLRLRHLKQLVEELRLIVTKFPDEVAKIDSSRFVSFGNVLDAFAAEQRDLVAEIRPTDAVTFSDLLARAEKLLAVVDIPAHQE